MYKFLLYLIIALHTILVLFIVVIPFIGKNYLLFLHAITGITILIHWIFNNNICSLTLIEYKLRETITGKPYMILKKIIIQEGYFYIQY